MSFSKFLWALVGFLHFDKKLTQQADATRSVENAVREGTRQQLRAMRRIGDSRPAEQLQDKLTEDQGILNYEVNGATVAFLVDPQGRTYLGSGDSYSEALDALTSKPGMGASVLERLLDLECVLFVGDGSTYELKQVVSREKFSAGCLEAPAVAEIRTHFDVPGDLDVRVGWRSGQDGSFESARLNELLGRDA